MVLWLRSYILFWRLRFVGCCYVGGLRFALVLVLLIDVWYFFCLRHVNSVGLLVVMYGFFGCCFGILVGSDDVVLLAVMFVFAGCYLCYVLV